MHKMKYLLFILFSFLMFSCKSQREKSLDIKVNTTLNKEYRNSIKTFEGKLNEVDYLLIKKNIEKELSTSIPDDKIILINFCQKAKNCSSLASSEASINKVIYNSLTISSGISLNNDAVDFFVYTEDAFFKDIFIKNLKFKRDSGFFHDTFFNDCDICTAFFILKPDGKFIKHYGDDYYTIVKNFMEKDFFKD
jgi:CRISPR/Cas system-associated endoribonuclease Cas2